MFVELKIDNVLAKYQFSDLRDGIFEWIQNIHDKNNF